MAPTSDTEIPLQPEPIDWWGLLSPILFSWQFVVFLVLLWFGVRFWWRKFDHHRVNRALYLVTPGSKSANAVQRETRKTNRKQGTGSWFDVLRYASAWPMWWNATVVRPDLKGLSRWQRLRLPITEVAVQLCRVGWLHVWSSVEDVTLLFGGPRRGKSALMGGAIIDYPGPVLVTSTRLDLLEATRDHRARKGVVYVFNPAGLGDVSNTLGFDPLIGCQNPQTAEERATDLMKAVSSGGSGDREYWENQGRLVLKVLLHAAALGERDMRVVQEWLADPENALVELTLLLKKSPMPILIEAAKQFCTTNEKTRSSITSTISPTLEWLSHPTASVAGSQSGGFQLDMRRVLEENATVYLLGREEAATAPLLSAFNGYLAREALRLAAGRRLAPTFGLFLDEAAMAAPVPLEKWTADFGGSGITIVAAFQSRAQVEQRWGPAGRRVILNNAARIVFFGGDKDTDDLRAWQELAGDRDDISVSRDEHGKVKGTSERKVPVLPGARLSTLPKFRVVVFGSDMPPVLGRVTPYWKRQDVKHPDGHPVVLLVAAAWSWVVDPVEGRRARTAAKAGG